MTPLAASRPRSHLPVLVIGALVLPGQVVGSQQPGQPNRIAVDSVVAALKRELVPLAHTDAGAPANELAAIGAAMGDPRVVALGEASHGSREIFHMKHRLFAYLVKAKGFSVLAIEANWPESEAVDQYIKTGQGDPRAALAAMNRWPWQTEELLALIEWMREYNRAPGRERLLSFTSIDMQDHRIALERALAAVEGTPQESAVRSAYAPVIAFSAADAQALRTAAEAADHVVRLLEREQALPRTVQLARIVAQALQNQTGTVIGYRDQMMAANVMWLLRDQHPREKVVIWAHNSHVGVGYPTHDGPPRTHSVPMGTWLRIALGPQMYVLGFAINGGAVRANIYENGRSIGVQEAALPPAEAGSGSLMLSATGVPRFFIDLKMSAGALRSWLSEPHTFQELGAGWDRAVGLGMRTFPLLPRFDGLIYFDQTSAARGLR